jgi:predicted RNase H-related nuclease YkuK (DUF458 family)
MNNITTLRTHLFDQLQRLRNSTGDELKSEIEKSKAIISVSSEILNSAKVEADIIKSVKELSSGFVPDVVGHIENNQLERKETPYEFSSPLIAELNKEKP